MMPQPKKSAASVRAASTSVLRQTAVSALIAWGALFATANSATAPLTADVTYRNFFGSMTFNRPVAFTPYPGVDSVYMVVEQVGKLRTVERRSGAWAKTDSAVIAVPVVSGTGGGKCATTQTRATAAGITTGYYESRGLLGFAFHPAFRTNRKYYVSYITVRDSSGSTHERSIVAERVADSTLRPKSSDSMRVLIDFCQPGWDHKGGHIEFGPDGMLYYASGDGGNQELWSSTSNPSLRRDTWLGKILRIDVTGPPDAGKAYRIPPDNPFRDSAAFLPEIWAWGLRNPWKWHFHPATGALWLGNVGYTNRDNIYNIPKGAYLGWPVWEGNHCSTASGLSGQCASTADRVLRPVIDLVHNTEARSVTGGTFFLGEDTTAVFHGAYFFGDFDQNWVRVARFNASGDSVLEIVRLENITNVVSFDRDNRGNLYATSLGTGGVTANTGVIYRLESPGFSTPVGVRPYSPQRTHRVTIRDVRALHAALRADPARYTVTGPDGRRVDLFSGLRGGGVVIVSDNQRPGATQLMVILPK